MNDCNTETDLTAPIPHYKEILAEFEFAKPFLDDPKIFNPDSPSLRNFLIQAFAHIHPDFHYLSFLNKEIEQEMIKAAEILQLLPTSTKKSSKLFDNLGDVEIRKFWIRLFALLHGQRENNFNFEENKLCFLKDMSKTLDYMHHNLAVIKEKHFGNESLNKEIEKWANMDVKFNQTREEISLLDYDSHNVEEVNIEMLLMDLKQVALLNKNLLCTSDVIASEHLEFFNNFTQLTKNINEYVINLKEINSSHLNELHHKILTEGRVVQSNNLYFLKKCCNYFKTLEYKDKFLQ